MRYLAVLVLTCSALACCVQEQPLMPEPASGVEEAVKENLENWLDRRVDKSNHKIYARHPWLSCASVTDIHNEFMFLANELGDPAALWDFQDFVETQRITALYRANPPAEEDLVIWLKETLELFDPDYIISGLE